MSESNQAKAGTNTGRVSRDDSRREALKKLGKYSAYTAPALLAILTPKKSHAS